MDSATAEVARAEEMAQPTTQPIVPHDTAADFVVCSIHNSNLQHTVRNKAAREVRPCVLPRPRDRTVPFHSDTTK